MARLTLAEALRSGKVDEFAAQAEANEVGPVDEADFERVLGKLVREPRSEDQTSHSSSRDCSTGK